METKTQGSSSNFTNVRMSGDERADPLGLLVNTCPFLYIFDMLVVSCAYIF